MSDAFVMGVCGTIFAGCCWLLLRAIYLVGKSDGIIEILEEEQSTQRRSRK